MRNLLSWALCLTVLGCNQERNKSIELMNHGVEMGRQKLYDRAVTDLKQAVTVDPSNDLAHFNLGIVYKDQKKWPDAANAFADAVKFSGDNASYRSKDNRRRSHQPGPGRWWRNRDLRGRAGVHVVQQ